MILSAVVVILIVLLSAYCLNKQRNKKFKPKRLIRLFPLNILMIDTLASVIISFWIVLAEVAFVCDSRSADFLINVCNGIYYSVLASYVTSKLITSPRILHVCVKIMVPSVLACVQIVLAAVAHFGSVGNKENKSTVQFCYDERSDTTVIASYCYGFVLLVMCIVLLFAKLYHDRKRGYWNPLRKLGVFATVLLSTMVALTYSLALGNVLSPTDENDCAQHADFLVVLGLFPAIVSTCVCGAGFMKALYNKKYEMSRTETSTPKHLQFLNIN